MVKKIISTVLLATTLLACVGCQDKYTGSGIVPDYSGSDKALNMYAFIGPTDGTYYTSSGKPKKGEDHRTVERYQEYKDCGFDTLLLLGNDPFHGAGHVTTVEAEAEVYATSQLKKNLDMCEEVGLQAIVFDNRIWQLTYADKPLIKVGETAEILYVQAGGGTYLTNEYTVYEANSLGEPTKVTITASGFIADVQHIQYQFEDMTALKSTLELYMSSYRNHSTFLGVSTLDEPPANGSKTSSVGDLTQAIKEIDPDIRVQTCLLPEYSSVDDAYEKYLDDYLTYSGNDIFSYDYYPFVGAEMNSETTENPQVIKTYAACLQKTAEVAEEHSVDWELILQSGGYNGWGTRFVNEADIRLQMNMALAFSADNIGYFTYWMFQTKAGLGYGQAIMSDTGEKILYDEVQRVNAEAKKLAKVILNFDYKKSYLGWYKGYESKPQYFANAVSSDLSDIKSIEQTHPVIINEMYDEARKQAGYMIVNATETHEKSTNTITVEFDQTKYAYAIVYINGEEEKVTLRDGKYTVTLNEGEGAFVLPY